MYILVFLVLIKLVFGNRRDVKRFNKKFQKNVKYSLKSIGDFSEWLSKQVTPVYKSFKSRKQNKNSLHQSDVKFAKVINLDERRKSKDEKAI